MNDRELSELVSATRRPASGEIAELEARIKVYETKHGFDSASLNERLQAGAATETQDVCDWLMLVALRDRIVSLEARRDDGAQK